MLTANRDGIIRKLKRSYPQDCVVPILPSSPSLYIHTKHGCLFSRLSSVCLSVILYYDLDLVASVFTMY